MKSISIEQQISSGATAWLCLTTLHHRRFLEDVIHVIGMPVGAHIRLRYRKTYVDPKLWHQVLMSSKLDSNVAIVVLAGSKGESISASPLRTGTIFEARCEGDLLVLDLVLEDFVFHNSAKDDFYNKVSSTTRTLPKSLASGQSSKGVYLQEINTQSLDLKAERSVAGWERAAAAFFKIDQAQSETLGNSEGRLPFLYFINNFSEKNSKQLRKTGYLNLEMGKQIAFEIHTISRPSKKSIVNPLGEVILELSHSAASFTSSRRARVDSSRDVKSIGISTSPLFRTTDGHVSVRTVLFKHAGKEVNEDVAVASTSNDSGLTDMLSAGKRSDTVVARYDFPLKVGRYRPLLACALIAAATSTSVYKFSTPGEFRFSDLLAPLFIFILTISGLGLGLIKK